ncbi:uncharacterized protein LOC143248810 isoform X1 [Tachypleus tridentatus]|uniref:uncharacterized protein LOC143248810 isoform X1 n=1 Tax=Tachypleus tridentatus TaxID=6853 RepID=UPI003FD47851
MYFLHSCNWKGSINSDPISVEHMSELGMNLLRERGGKNTETSPAFSQHLKEALGNMNQQCTRCVCNTSILQYCCQVNFQETCMICMKETCQERLTLAFSYSQCDIGCRGCNCN